MTLDIIVIGGGLAGLSAARALAPSGHRVRVYERSLTFGQEGWGVTIQPPARKVLSTWGIQEERLKPVQMDTIWRRGYDDLANFGDVDLALERKEHGISSAEWMMERKHLHAALLDQLRTFPNVNIYHGINVLSENGDLSTGSVRLSYGVFDHADAVIGADGVHSSVVGMFPSTDIRGHISQATRAPQRAYHCMLHTAEGMRDPIARMHLSDVPFRSGAGFYTGTSNKPSDDLGLGAFPANGGDLLDIVAIYHDPAATHDTGPWQSAISEDQYFQEARGRLMAQPLQRMIRIARQHARFFIGMRDALPRFNFKRGVLIGDAAHVVHPAIGAGASLGIEDAFCIGILLESATSANVARRLELFHELRYERCLRIKYSRESRPEGTGSSAEMLNELIPGARIPTEEELEVLRWSEDIEQRARDRLRRENRDGTTFAYIGRLVGRHLLKWVCL